MFVAEHSIQRLSDGITSHHWAFRIDPSKMVSSMAISYPKALSSLPTYGLPISFKFATSLPTDIHPRQMLHDPEVYPNPHQFDPARFIPTPGKDVERDPRHACFGFGRRICPGLHLAEASLYILAAMSLAVFDISPVIENGIPILPEHENTDGTIR